MDDRRKALLAGGPASIAVPALASGRRVRARATELFMLKCYELVGFMPAELAREILETTYRDDKPLYKSVLAAVAQALRVRPAFLEKKPRAQRHLEMINVLGRPRLEEAAATLLRGWLLKSQAPMLADFLDALDIPHQQGVVEEFPATVPDDRLKAAVETLLSKYPREKVALYLNAIQATSGVQWANLEQLLHADSRLQIA